MEVRVYSQDLRFQGVCENQTSVIWTRRYFTAGCFEIHAPITEANVNLFRLNNLVWLREALEAGVIEDLSYQQTNNTNEITVKGRFLESYMDRRIIYPTFNFSGKIEVGMRNLLSSISDAIPYVELGELQGFDEEGTFQVTWKDLLTSEQKLAQSVNFGFRFKPDFNRRKIHFDIYKGLNRVRSQHVISFAEFSDEYNNIDSATFSTNNQLEKCVAYVAGEGEGANRTIVMVGFSGSEGYDCKLIYVGAREITSDGLTPEQYQAALIQRGKEKLDENIKYQSLECVTIPLGNFKYKTDYDLGDIVTTRKNNWSISQDLRITEIKEIYEHGSMQVEPTLGIALPTTLNMED